MVCFLLAVLAVAQGTPAPTYWTTAPTAEPTMSPSVSQAPTMAPTETPLHAGSDFVLAFMHHFNNFRPELFLFLTGDEAGTGTVSIPGVSFSQDFDVVPGETTTVQIPSSSITSSSNVVANKGVRISSTSEVTVYGLNWMSATTDGFLGLPTASLGTQYIALGYISYVDPDPEDLSSGFAIVADSDDTVVTITPSTTTSGRSAGVPYDVTLNALDVYQLLSDTRGEDITGTIISSNKPIGVFSGGSCLQVPLGTSFCDHIVEMIPPIETWGSNFYTAPLARRSAGDVFRILASEDDTDVIIDDVVVAQLQAGNYFETELSSSTAHEIETTAPSLVAQYNKGADADGVITDPFQMLIIPSEQFLDAYTITTPTFVVPFTSHFINVVVLTKDLNACTIDGTSFTNSFTRLGALRIGSTGYSGGQISVAVGTHRLECPKPFGAFVYGHAFNAAYGYPGGMALRDVD